MIRWPSLCSVPSRLGEPHAEAGGLGGHCLSIQKENSSKDKGCRPRSDAVSVRRQAGLARRIRRGHITPLRLWEASAFARGALGDSDRNLRREGLRVLLGSHRRT